ncbi:MAG: hypothetical protein LBO69_06595 [Ignavibacteria bacterium]|jgi:uncharacterized membrane protein YqiK|nr:hypothetical protein [Ignavibacteria bacterium]
MVITPILTLAIIIAIFVLVLLFNAFAIVKSDELATIERRYLGKEMPNERTVALRGEVGIQANLFGPGLHFLIPFVQKVKKYKYFVINEGEIGCVEAITGTPIKSGNVMASKVECDMFQDGEAFLLNGGQKGPQLDVLPPGEYRINPHLFILHKFSEVNVENGHLRVVSAIDGGKLKDGRILADSVSGHCNFQKADEFLKNGGQRGQQIDFLMPGTYRINLLMFQISDNIQWVSIDSKHIGVVTTKEGHPISNPNAIAAKEFNLERHSNFQDASKFLEIGGEKGLQPYVLRPGQYAINPFFASVSLEEMVEIDIGQCAVVTSYVGQEYEAPAEDSKSHNVNAKLVPTGYKGIWNVPLGPGMHPLNPRTCSWSIVPTTQVVLSWANAKSSAYDYDKNLKTITLRTSDAFDVNMDVQVMFHIPMDKAPAVVADLGSIQDLITQVLEPAVSSHFRNAAQEVKALDLYTQRAGLASRAKSQIADVLGLYHIESRDVMITDVILPEEIVAPVKLAAIAIEDKKKFENQEVAQNARKSLEFAKKQADMQEALVASQREIEISDNKAKSVAKTAEGERNASIFRAEAEAKQIELKATADAMQIKLIADSQSESIRKVGLAEAEIIMEKGKSQAEAYKLSQEALGDDYAKLQMVESLGYNQVKLIPDNIIIGGSEGGSLINQFMAIEMAEKVTGKSWNTSK